MTIDFAKTEAQSRFDGKGALRTNTDLSAPQVALKYKELWQVEHAFRDMKSILESRPIFHQRDETIRGHVFCSFLALVLRKKLDRRLGESGHNFEWANIKQDLKALQETVIEDKEPWPAEANAKGHAAKCFSQWVWLSLAPSVNYEVNCPKERFVVPRTFSAPLWV